MKAGSPLGSQLDDLARDAGWERAPSRTLSVARAIYLRLPRDARLWLRGREFVAIKPDTIGPLLA